MNADKNLENQCCPEFAPELWDDKVIEWSDKKFIKDRVFTFFYMPVNFGSVMRRISSLVEKSGANIPDGLALSDHTSKWNMDIYLAVDRVIQNAENISLSGKFYAKVFEGPYRDTGKWCDEFKKITSEKGMKILKWYMWYTTCPKCAKKYGKNYVVIIAGIE